MKLLWAVALAAVGACTTPNTTKACSEGSCLNPEFPYCDTEGVISGEPGTCIAVTCTPGEIETCLGDDALTCNATGDGYEHLTCDLGCSATPKPHCKYIEPRYLPEMCDMAASDESLVVNGSTSLDPNLDSNCNGGVVSQAGAAGICVLRYRQIAITANGQLKLTGKSDTGAPDTVGRVVAFVADEQLSIDGSLDISADGPVNGPGGGLMVSGGGAQLVSADLHKAGAGAGGQTAGAPGGSTTTDGDGGIGGLATADPALLSVLFGGAAANRGGGMGPVTLGGGGGGGGATLVSCKGSISISGVIDAGGGGGTGGRELFGADTPAWGGGAGGYVVLQAKRIEVTGQVFANGGGGGTGMAADLLPGADGADGLRSATMPAPGSSGKNGGGNGGRGGVGIMQPTAGGKSTAIPTSDASPGGGGGSVGFLQTYTPDGIEPMLSGATASPRFRPNITLKTR